MTRSRAAETPPGPLVLMGLYNGAAHLAEQVESILAQEGPPARLLIADDGSTDASRARIETLAATHAGREITVIDGPRAGFAANFLHLLRAAGPEVPCVALADQDDIWMPDKLARGTAALAEVPAGCPALYGGRSWVWDPARDQRRLSPHHARPPGFANALVQSLAGGNTMMLNRAALDLVQAASLDSGRIVAHDWWLYQIVAGAGGTVIYDPEPALLYRQHGANAIGANDTLRAGLARLSGVLGGRFRDWNETNVAALAASRHRLTPENRRRLEAFAAARRARLPRRLAGLRRAGIYRQTAKGGAGLWLAALLGRI